jgi:ketosteroid isomerase-like protein
MKKLTIAVAVIALVGVAFALTETKDDLIKLDKEWGVANLKADRAALEKIYASDILAVFPEGMSEGRAQMLEGLEPAASTNYVTSDYKVMMLGSDVAVMAHNAGSGENAYRSLHVLAKRDGRWQVVATSTIPAQSSSSD